MLFCAVLVRYLIRLLDNIYRQVNAAELRAIGISCCCILPGLVPATSLGTSASE